MNVLVTGGAGYIGSHTTLALFKASFNVVVLDNLSNSSEEPINRVSLLIGKSITFIQGDVRDYKLILKLLIEYKIDAVIHFSGLKSVIESFYKPLNYYDNNVNGTLSLCKAMAKANVFTLIFSSSATVYGDQTNVPISENQVAGFPKNPYGQSKYMVEQILNDLALSDNRWKISILRYFNPIGAHESGSIGEDTKNSPKNLIPYIAQVALGKLPELTIFGSDYATIDGTGVRDYIHVLDLADGHIAALKTLKKKCGAHVWNLGTGKGYSVLQIVETFENVSGKTIPYHIASRRPGDVAISYANPKKAEMELHWKAKYNLYKMLEDTWNWFVKNPNGYN